jgi:hypothetical protein
MFYKVVELGSSTLSEELRLKVFENRREENIWMKER